LRFDNESRPPPLPEVNAAECTLGKRNFSLACGVKPRVGDGLPPRNQVPEFARKSMWTKAAGCP
jgi:hypothetical protein